MSRARAAAYKLPERTAYPKGDLSAVPPIVHEVLRSSGQPLDADARTYMEPRFGHDFSRVRVHTDARAAESASAVNARAYTVGRDVVFGAGQYAPSSTAGRRLLAHELTHVVQQRGTGAGLQASTAISSPSDASEIEAHRAASSQAAGAPAVVRVGASTPALQRQGSGDQAAESPGFWGTVWGGLQGEFNEDPSFAMIGVDVGVSLVPVLDQASDVRDVTAHLYYMIFRRQYDRLMRWIGLVFSLIGLIPELGSAIKGASKFVIKGVREVLSHITDLLRPFRRFAPEVGDLSRLFRYVSENWNRMVGMATSSWHRLHTRATSIVNSVPGWGIVGKIREGLSRAGNMAPSKLRDGFAWIKNKWDEVTLTVEEQLGRRSRIDPEIDASVERSFDETFSGPEPAPATRQTGPESPERRAGFTDAQVTAFRRLLGKPFTEGDVRVLGQLWQRVANPSDAARVTLDNSRSLFDNHRQRFWRAVRGNSDALELFRSAGCIFRGGDTTAPIFRLADGREIRMTIDHIVERQGAPGRALDPANLRISFWRENTQVLRLLHQLDPFQAVR